MTASTGTTSSRPATGHSAIVIGDAMVDAYFDSLPAGVSDEAPILVLDWVETKRTFGGMLNTAKSLAALGFDVHAFGSVNEDDDAGAFVRDECERLGIVSHWFNDGRPTIEKSRVRTHPDRSPVEQLARIDIEIDAPLSDECAAAMLAELRHRIAQASVVVVSDYIKGVLTESVTRMLVQESKANAVPLLVDAKPESLEWYAGATLLKPNEEEARRFLARFEGESAAARIDCEALVLDLSKRLDASVLMTCAGNGMYLVDREHDSGAVNFIAPGDVSYVESTSGAGDVVLAAMSAAVSRGMTLAQGAESARSIVAQTILRDGTCTLETTDDLSAFNS